MLDKDAIRNLIRDVIAEEVKHLRQGQAPSGPQPVRITSSADLASFACEVLRLADDPKIRAAIEAGHHPFRLAADAVVASAPATGPSNRIDVGIVTEAVIGKLPAHVTRLQLGPSVSITPLARDKAKARNISVERIRQ